MPRKFLNGIDATNQKIINLADGTNPTDAVTLQQIQALIRGLDWKNSVRAASVGNLTLSGTQTVDGVALIAGDLVLAKDQTTGSANGVYTVASGAWSRVSWYDDSTEVTAASAIPVESGTVNGDAVFILTNDGAITIGTTALTFTRLGGNGATYTASPTGGLTLSGSAFSINIKAGGGLVADATGTSIDPAYSGLAKRYAIDVPTNATATITHNLGTQDHTLTVYLKSTGEVVEPDKSLGINADTLTFAVAPTTGQYRAVVTG